MIGRSFVEGFKQRIKGKDTEVLRRYYSRPLPILRGFSPRHILKGIGNVLNYFDSNGDRRLKTILVGMELEERGKKKIGAPKLPAFLEKAALV